jgi:(+)-neomenthol dehydrogenase
LNILKRSVETIPKVFLLSIGKMQVAVVTGANQGLGYGICKRLAETQRYSIILTGRRADACKQAAQSLAAETGNSSIQSRQLDITSSDSINDFTTWLDSTFTSGINVLVNNASIAFDPSAFSADECASTMAVNLEGTVNITEALKHRMPPIGSSERASIVIVSSGGSLSGEAEQMLQNARSGQDLINIGDHFVQSIRDGTYKQRGFPKAMMPVSKQLENVYAQLLGDELRDRNVFVAAVHPGSVRSKMSNFKGSQSPYTAAEGPAMLACNPLSPAQSGSYFMGTKQVG